MPEEWTVNPTKYVEKDVKFQVLDEENIQLDFRVLCQMMANVGWMAATPFKYYECFVSSL